MPGERLCSDCSALAKIAAEKKKASREEKLKREAEDPKQIELAKSVEELRATFQDGPPGRQVCPPEMLESLKTRVSPDVLLKAIQATRDSKRVPGINPNQMLFIFVEAFSRGSSVVLGGSRVKTLFSGKKSHREEGEIDDKGEFISTASDLDVGYGNLEGPQAVGINSQANKMGPPPIEQFVIIPGKESKTLGTIESAEEFFHRTGPRPQTDPKSKVEPIAKPSGSITYTPDGQIVDNGPEVERAALKIPVSGARRAGGKSDKEPMGAQ